MRVLKFLLKLAFTALLRLLGYVSPDLYIPFWNVSVHLPWVLYMILIAFVMVGTVNAANLTDGVDGLLSGVTIGPALFFIAAKRSAV